MSARLWVLALATLAGRLSALPRQVPAAYAARWGAGPLHDEPVRRLSEPMRAFVSERLREMISQAQRLLFPLWELPIPAVADSLDPMTEASRPLAGADLWAPSSLPPLQMLGARPTSEGAPSSWEEGDDAPPDAEATATDEAPRRRRQRRGRAQSPSPAAREASPPSPRPAAPPAQRPTSPPAQQNEGAPERASGEPKKRQRKRRRKPRGGETAP